MDNELRPKVGIGVYILNDKSQVLLIKEKRQGQETSWAPPGGHLEFGEEFLDCVKREVREEVGLVVVEAELWFVNNNIDGSERHYVNVDFLVKEYSGEPKIMEPEKCEQLNWFNLNQLPRPLLLPVKNFFRNNPKCLCKSGKNFIDCHGKK